MINGKTLYAYNKDTGKREEFKLEAYSVTFANSLEYEKFQGSSDTADGFGGGFFPAPKKTDRGTYIDGNKQVQSIPYFLSSDGKWSYAVTDISMLLRQDDAAETYLGIHAKADDALHADESDVSLACSGLASRALALENARQLQTRLDITTPFSFNGTEESINEIGVTGTLNPANGGTGKTDLADVTVGTATNAINDQSGQNIIDTYMEKPIMNLFSIATDQWTENEAIENYEYEYFHDIVVPGIDSSFIPTVIVDLASQEGAMEAEVCPIAETFDSVIRIYSKQVPIVTVSGLYYLMRKNDVT